MSHPRALTEQEAIAAEQWFTEYERIGTFNAKAAELGVSRDTLRDAIRRVRGEDTRTTRTKLNEAELEALCNEVNRKLGINATFHMERRQNGEEQSAQPDSV